MVLVVVVNKANLLVNCQLSTAYLAEISMEARKSVAISDRRVRKDLDGRAGVVRYGTARAKRGRTMRRNSSKYASLPWRSCRERVGYDVCESNQSDKIEIEIVSGARRTLPCMRCIVGEDDFEQFLPVQF
jgi:hypothetical protein